MQRWGIALIRMVVGFTFVMHGGQKLFIFGISGVTGMMGQMGLPFPHVSAVLITATEFLGGLALLFGFGTRVVAIALAFAMLVAMLFVHIKNGYFLPMGAEYPLVLFAANIAFILTGSGTFAIENRLWRRHGSNSTRTRPGTRESRMA